MEFDAEPEQIYATLANPLLIPKWADVFADRVEHCNDSTYRVTKGDDTFNLYLVLNKAEWRVEYLRDLPDGRRVGAQLTLSRGASGGSVVSMRVPVAPGAVPEQVDAVLKQELKALRTIVGK